MITTQNFNKGFTLVVLVIVKKKQGDLSPSRLPKVLTNRLKVLFLNTTKGKTSGK